MNDIEGKNISEGVLWLGRRPKSFDEPIDDAAREIHKCLFGRVWKWAGIYRHTEKNIGVPVWQISTEMRERLNDVRY